MNLFIEWLPIILVLLLVGCIAGLLAGLLGIGGGIVIVPTFYLVVQSLGASLSTAMLLAVGTSLMAIVPTSMSSTLAHYRRGNVDVALLKRWAPPMLAGVLLGSILAINIEGVVLTVVFGIFAILIALNMWRSSDACVPVERQIGRVVQSLIAGTIGFLSVIMGIGGGALGVPTMTSLGAPAHRAIGTAAVFGLIISFPGTIMLLASGHAPTDAPIGTFGFVNVPGALCIVSMSILFAPIGVKIGAHMDGHMLKRVFALLLILAGVRMIWQAFISVS